MGSNKISALLYKVVYGYVSGGNLRLCTWMDSLNSVLRMNCYIRC